jgi:hypothetical protein
LITPQRALAAPTNTHLRIEGPTGMATGNIVLRARGGAQVPIQLVRTMVTGMVTLVELFPSSALLPRTRFEVATIDPTAHPSTIVFGNFTTGDRDDTTPPQFDSIGHQRTRINAQWGFGDCSIHGPWVELADLVVRDRADAQLVYGLWNPDASGTLSTQRSPDAVLIPFRGVVTIGQSSLCDMQPPLKGPVVTFAVAAIDEAGNVSQPIRVRADVTRNTP